MADLASGIRTKPLTFVFTDVVGSTRLWAADPEGTSASFVLHDQVVRDECARHTGEVFGWAGDSFRAAFDDVDEALGACQAIHERLASTDWGQRPPLRVRIGVTRGPALHRDGEYFGPILNTAARLQEVAQPGQTVMSAEVASDTKSARVTPLGTHRIRDVAEPLELFQLGTRRFAPVRTVDLSRSSLPLSQGPLFGRDEPMTDASAALAELRPVTLVGTGGVGKTHMAVDLAHLEVSGYPDGAYFVDLVSVREPEGVSAAVASGSRIKLSKGAVDEQIVDWFRDRRALLVLDNCEHVISAVTPLVDQLVAQAPNIGLLCTSREPLNVVGEQVIRVGPLAIEGGSGPAVDLFIQRIRDEVSGFEPSPVQRDQIVAICEHLDGIPLALELAAARGAILGLDHILQGMHDRFRLLSASSTDRTRALGETIDWSFGLLSDAEQDLFASCGVFNGSFDLPAVSALNPGLDRIEIAELLHSLIRKSLISLDGPVGGRFRLLETVRAYALMRLSEQGREHALRDLHFDHFRRLLAVDDLAAANDLDRGVRLAPEWSSIAGALEWGCQQKRWQPTAQIAAGCVGLWEEAVPAVEGRYWVDRVRPHLDQVPISKAILDYALSSLEAQLDNWGRVNEILGSLIDADTPELAANALAVYGYMQARLDPTRALALLDRCDQIVDGFSLGPDPQAARWWARGAIALYRPDFVEARRCFERGFDVARGAPRCTPNTVYTGLALATMDVLQDRPTNALEVLDSYNSGNSRWDSSPVIRAIALIDLDRVTEAVELAFGFAEESLLGRLGRMSNDAMLPFAALALHRGDCDHAWALLQQAVTPRTPFTIGLAEGLAARIDPDYEGKLRSMHRNRTVDLADLDAIERLRAELDRFRQGIGSAENRTPNAT